ncbi:hypothetical protein [Streptomyces sp. NBC_00996]|uniref:hypothetical protein n=1 Tax=Streptomyces sp. NBC_00996 TaxID=2903710 RepID=UPI00386346F5
MFRNWASLSGHVRPANPTPARTMSVAWSPLLLPTLLAWFLVVEQAHGMEPGPGTMGLDLAPFLLLWVIMMIAMMVQSVAPMAITWARPSAVSPPGRPARPGSPSSWADT